MNLLLIISNRPVFTGFIPSFKDACSQLSIMMDVFILDEDKSYDSQRIKLKKYIKKRKPDKILCINDFCQSGNFLVDYEITQLVSCYVWFVDSMHRMSYYDSNLHFYRGVSSFEPTDCTLSEKYKVSIQYVPLTAGEKIFCTNNEPEEKEYDVSFVGLVAESEKRLKVLTAIARYCKKNRHSMICYGHFWHNSHLLQSIIGSIKFKYKYPDLYPYVINKRISPQQCMRLYKRTKINLNIHVEHHTGFNCRTFEILGNGNFELCDEQNNRVIHFENKKHLVFYHTADEAVQLIDYYLSHPKERENIATQGKQFVNTKYTFANSLRQVLFLE